MPHAGYADSIMNDDLGFYLDISSKSSPNLSLEPSWKVLYQRVTQVDQMTRAAAERQVTLNLCMFSLISFAIDSSIFK